MGLSERQKYILSCCFVLVALAAVVIGLTVGLRTSVPQTTTTRRPTTTPQPTRPPRRSARGSYRFAAVSADAEECSTIGTDIIARKRGSAVDGAIAAMACVGVINLQSAGVGGGHFMTIYDRPRNGTQKVVKTVIAREQAPSASTEDMFVNMTGPKLGGIYTAIPGEVRGWYEAWNMFGRVQWKELLEPTIKLCRDGHRVTPYLYNTIRRHRNNVANDRNLRELFMPQGRLVQPGDIIKRPKMQRTLEMIADDPHTFYNGTLAEDIAQDIQEYNGTITKEDLANYTALIKDPITVTLDHGNYRVFAPRPPGSGAVYAFILNILNGYKFHPANVTNTDSLVLTHHRVIEAWKFAYAKRSAIGDEDFLGAEFQEMLTNMTSSDYAEATRLRINDTHTQDVSYYRPAFSQKLEQEGTTHLSVIAPDGAAVAFTGTINHALGAQVRGSRTGIFFNNIMDDFSTPGQDNYYGFPPSRANFIRPWKRPMSSTCPTVILDNNNMPVHVTGASGGGRITSTVSAVTVNNLWFNKSLGDSVDELRLHHQLMPNKIYHERNYPQDILEGLRQKGHEIELRRSIMSVINPVAVQCSQCQDCENTACVQAVTDFRKTSKPDGF